MAYVLEYVVVAGGEPATIKGVSHQDAANRFLREPRYGKTENWPGKYTPVDGQMVTVIGKDQEEFAQYFQRSHRHRDWEALPERGKGKQRSRINTPEPHVPPEPKTHTIKFHYELVVTYMPVVIEGAEEEAA